MALGHLAQILRNLCEKIGWAPPAKLRAALTDLVQAGLGLDQPLLDFHGNFGTVMAIFFYP